MDAPQPRTAAATAARIRQGQETMAAKLRAAGWTVTPPKDAHVSDPHADTTETCSIAVQRDQ
jgi:hypothetical protein